MSVQEMLSPPAVPDGYDETYGYGVPEWPVPRTGPDKRVAIAAIVGLSMSIIALVIVAVLVVNTLQGALISSRRVGHGLPTTTSAPSAATTSTGELVIAPTQVTLTCQSNQGVTLQLTNNGQQAVSWQAQANSSGQNDQSNLAIQPDSGTLAGGASQTITVTVNSGDSHGHQGTQGTIQFAVASGPQSGVPAQVSYTASSCGGGG
jgi:hypothetical protein